jgi:hypothetical protein
MGNNAKHKTFRSQTNKTIRNQKKQNLLSDTENEVPRFYWVSEELVND